MKSTKTHPQQTVPPVLYAPGVRFNWRPESVAPYESAWSLVNKFVALNHVDIAETAWLLVRSEWAVAKRHSTSSIAVASARDLDPRRLQWLFELPGTMVDHAFIGPYRYPVITSWGFDGIAENLRFCPECIRKGFHTPLFQVLAIAKCPIHLERLTEQCPRCNGATSYRCSRHTIENPYGCPCGHSYFSDLGGSRWAPGISEAEGRQIERYLRWRQRHRSVHFGSWKMSVINAEARMDQLLNGLSYVHELDPIKGWHAAMLVRTPGVVQNAVTAGPRFAALRVQKDAPRRPASSVPLSHAHDKDEEWFEALCKEFYGHYRSLRRYVKRRLLRRHRGCRPRVYVPGGRAVDDRCSWFDGYEAWDNEWGGPYRDPWYRFERFQRGVEKHKNFLLSLDASICAEDRHTQAAQELLCWIGARWFVLILLASLYARCRRTYVPLIELTVPYVHWQPADATTPHVLRWWSVSMIEALRDASRPSESHLAQQRRARQHDLERMHELRTHMPRG